MIPLSHWSGGAALPCREKGRVHVKEQGELGDEAEIVSPLLSFKLPCRLSMNKCCGTDSAAWAGRCLRFTAQFMQRRPNKRGPVIFVQPKMGFGHPEPLVAYWEDSKCV